MKKQAIAVWQWHVPCLVLNLRVCITRFDENNGTKSHCKQGNMVKLKLTVKDIGEDPIRGEIYSVERLEEYATFLANEIKPSSNPRLSQPLLPRMRDNGKMLLTSYRVLTEAIHRKEAISPAAEWLVDNFHIVEDQLREIQEDLPPSYYAELPKLAIGELAGYPRIYAIALALVAHTDSFLETNTIRRFIQAFQKVSPLNIGELWALAITLRLALVENLRRLSLRSIWDREKRMKADHLADQLIESASSDAKRFQQLVEKIPECKKESVQVNCAFIAQLTKRLRDQEVEIWPACQCLDECLEQCGFSTEQVVHMEHQRQAANQNSVANVITSMRLLSSLDWQEFFESVSLVDQILKNDPTEDYEKMDFKTRDHYRHVVERIAKRTKASELTIAQNAVDLAVSAKSNDPSDFRRAHVGYYLHEKGVEKIKESFRYRPRLKERVLNFIHFFPSLFYFMFLFSFVALTCAVPVIYAQAVGAPRGILFVIGILLFVPCSDLAVSISNFLLTHLIGPVRMPKMDMSKGVPDDARTMVVVPCMLCDKKAIAGLIEKLEVRYLGNRDENIFFALLTDFTDAPAPSAPNDESLLQLAAAGIARLNHDYANLEFDRFFLLHRKRLWNSAENVWMGWERKRGKIHEFNRLLRGATDTSYINVTAPQELLSSIRLVITLDTDTQLTRDSARKLIGTSLHPLNRGVLNPSSQVVTEGYGILQPRISISLESSARSLFAQIFSGYTGIDPYTTAVSDIYQDLFAEGIYTGKGLYEVDLFEAALKNRAPENRILSHDLFEGLFARTALVTDIEFLDDYPSCYDTFFTRQHRWTRGDWQIGRWIFSPQLSFIAKWKIADNLRRSLIAPFTLFLLVAGWTVLPGSPFFWSLLGLVIIGLPSLLHVTNSIMVSPRGVPWTSHFWSIWGKARINFAQFLLSLIFLAHQAHVQLDAVGRSLYRQLISKKKLLEWIPAHLVERQSSQTSKPLWQRAWPTECGVVILGFTLASFNPASLASAGFFLFLWLTYPMVALATRTRWVKAKAVLTESDEVVLRKIARRTWHFFETFVGPESNWLPPDNYQEDPKPVIAYRTSPTNIGLYAMSAISACDLGYISAISLNKKFQLLLETLKKLERYDGHFLNWYDAKTLEPLFPKYISTVDSGNLASHILAIKQASLEIPRYHIINPAFLHGLKDAIAIIEEEAHKLNPDHKSSDLITPKHLVGQIQACQKMISQQSPKSLSGWDSLFHFLIQSLDDIRDTLSSLEQVHGTSNFDSLKRWVAAMMEQVRFSREDLLALAPWISEKFSENSLHKIINALDENYSFLDAVDLYEQTIKHLEDKHYAESKDASVLKSLLESSKAAIEGQIETSKINFRAFEQIFNEMNFKFLLAAERGVFSVGFNVTENRQDNALYDLLASEARVTSFVAIAKGDVGQEHWFKLGRTLVPVLGERALISWTASIFEYLMPLLIMRDFENTLLDETDKVVVKRQISYGKEQGIPWGISEAGYNARDLQLNYQYGPFGIPGLGLKRGLSHDLVVSPYSTLLAALVDPNSAVANLRRLIKNDLLSEFGFYESVDYTPDRLPEYQKFAILRSFMAHHNGMSLVAITNVLNNMIFQRRFHADPLVKATELLLQERIPEKVVVRPPRAAEIELSVGALRGTNNYQRVYRDPKFSMPRIQLLSNRNYSVMISTDGSGYSKCEGRAITRWREDATRDNSGSFIFIKKLPEKTYWSATYQPLCKSADSYEVKFGEDKVEFWREDADVSTRTEIIVAPEDNMELRRVMLTNHGSETCDFEITSYFEPVLAPPADDLNHQAFSNLFIETEFISSCNALLARRRPRSSIDAEVWGFHVIATDSQIVSTIQYETDRARFVGRGRNLTNPIAITSSAPLSNTVGAVLDPVMSLRVRIRLGPGEATHISFATGLSLSRQEALRLADRYHDVHSFDREANLAWTKSQIDLRHLGIDSEDAYLFQRLAERILYSNPYHRPPSHVLAQNTKIQSSLWPYGISGDLPIVAIRISENKDIVFVRKLLRGHEYLRHKGLFYDFVILNDHRASYFQELQDEIARQIRNTGSQGWLNKPGGIYILRLDVIPEKDQALIQSIARVAISADQGSLKEQINRKLPEENYPPLLSVSPPKTYPPAAALKIPELKFFNGLGGFAREGREYVIVLHPNQWTPAPWINVIANSGDFGFQVSEVGSGFTWSVNSRENRLTPWSNDPVCDPSGEIIYLRDEDSGEVWGPTPLPIRGDTPYMIKHGQGYTSFEHASHGLLQRLTVFAPEKDSVKISRLSLKNASERSRKISITYYVEWVLGSTREKSAPFLVSEIDAATEVIFARNPFNNEFAGRVAFAAMNAKLDTYTCDRKEFLGRGGNYSSPKGLKRVRLSQRKGTGKDPCAVMQTTIELAPGEEREIILLLGQTGSLDDARDLCRQYRVPKLVQKAFDDLNLFWERILGRIQIKTPDPGFDLLSNRWLLYQTISCRLWARSALYQSGGAYGFRDQLQDCMSLVYSAPELARDHILRAASRQFREGDVQHWWHLPTGRGVRTRFSDDLLWLPFVVSHYVKTTGDTAILDEVIPFIDGPPLKPEQEDSYSQPEVSSESATLRGHCTRAIDRSLAVGRHGLPLMGSGDWNDGMNRVGHKGEGESVWMGWFLYAVLRDFLPYDSREKYKQHMNSLKMALEENAWDGEWYRRAFFDDGTPLGSKSNDECRIDSIAQSWAVLSGAGDPKKQIQAMQKTEEYLVRPDKKLILLFTPPFDKTALDPGYVKGYVPGVRENGGQYTHAAIWVMMAFAKLGNGNRALELLKMLNPINHSLSKSDLLRYKTEPYVVAADIYAHEAYVGRGGWSWYTGSSSWLYRAGLESLLGFELRNDRLYLNPCLPNAWNKFEIFYRYKSTQYHIKVENPRGLSKGSASWEVDGKAVAEEYLTLVDDGKDHGVTVTLLETGSRFYNGELVI